MSEPIKGYGDGKGNTIYEYSNGRKEKWSGGWLAWRNNNPGNVTKNDGFVWDGEIGVNGRFCVFSDPKWGQRATKIIMRGQANKGKTLAEFITRYAPPSENPTAEYIKFVSKLTGILPDTKLMDVMEKIDSIAAAIFEFEDPLKGTIEVLEEGKKTGRYIWRTSKDDRVRASHKPRDGQVFEWSNPPPDGHPGEAFGCRCKAEDVD